MVDWSLVTIVCNTPRDPNEDDDDEDEESDTDEREPAVVREPDEDE